MAAVVFGTVLPESGGGEPPESNDWGSITDAPPAVSNDWGLITDTPPAVSQDWESLS